MLFSVIYLVNMFQMSFLIDGKVFKCKVFTEDVGGCTPNSMSAARRQEDVSVDVGSFSPPECHTACSFYQDDTTLKIFTFGGHFRYDIGIGIL